MSRVGRLLNGFSDWVREPYGFAPEEVDKILQSIYLRGDRIILWMLMGHCALALVLVGFYETWWITTVITAIAMSLFTLSRWLLPGHLVTRCAAGVALQMFVALHIYQLHGMPEMHFFFFTGFTIMVIYMDWVCMWPGALLIISQHIVFAWLHNQGAPLYFFPEAYVGLTKLFFHFGIAVSHVFLCGIWAAMIRRQTLQAARQQADLLAASQRAEEASAAKATFLAMMSHEIRTPMNAVSGMAQLLEDTPLNAEQRRYVASLRQGTEGLLHVINDVLDFSKIEAGKLEIHLAAFDLEALLDEVNELLRSGAEEKGLSLELEYAAESPRWLMGDASRIRQVMVNLVGNAIKYTDQGSVVVKVTGGGRIRVEVCDSGQGIPADLQPQLFQEFVQLDRKLTRRHGGTGLGLAITKQLVALMGGEIGMRSEVGRGSVFWFELEMEQAGEPLRKGEPLVQLPQIGAKVLVAEDNLLNRAIIVAFLEKFGCEATLAGNGAEALEWIGRGRFDLVLMDCQMPEVDGFEATRRIRAGEGEGARIPIIAMTANAMSGDREMCLREGMDDYISKPISIANLAEVLERWAPRGEAGATLAEAAIPPHQKARHE
jgi:signal transduction histidine kinase/ActR/RegA family two-component response regulator